MPRIIRLHVTEPQEALVAEKMVHLPFYGHSYIEAGSRIFCGHCGEIVCTVNRLLNFGDFKNVDFHEAAMNKQYMATLFAFKHKDHTMFPHSVPYHFWNLDAWFYLQNQHKIRKQKLSHVDELIANIKEGEEHGEA